MDYVLQVLKNKWPFHILVLGYTDPAWLFLTNERQFDD